MKLYFSIIFLLCCLARLGASPWDLDPETRNVLNAQIDAVYQKKYNESRTQGKTDHLVDFERKRLNISSRNCHYCQHYEQLKRSYFEKRWPDQPSGHCFGSSLFFIQYLLTHQESLSHSCSAILSHIQNEPNFEELVHSFSMNQSFFYLFNGLQDPLELNPELMKGYFFALVGIKPSEYYFLPRSVYNAAFDKASVYVTLKSLPDQLIMVCYSTNEGISHCIAVSTRAEKLFIFDPNLGMYQFPDLETLSWNAERVLRDYRFRWLAAFSIRPALAKFE